MRMLHFALWIFLVCSASWAAEWQDAAEANDTAKLKQLLDANPQLLNVQDSDGKTALHLAAAKNNFAAAQFLVERGADVNIKSRYGLTALKLAEGFGHAQMADFLRKRGGTSGSLAAKKPASKTAEQPLATITNSTKLNAFQKDVFKTITAIRQSPGKGFGALHAAAFEGQIPEAQKLLTSGTSINVTDESGFTPLHWAVEGGHKPMVEFLLSQKADINALTKPGDTPLTIAVVRKHGAIIETLLAHKADPNLAEKNCPAPLVYAATEQMAPVVAALLKAGADVNRTNVSTGWTPIHAAAYHNNLEILTLLLPYKPKLDIKNKDGLTALDLAQKHASSEFINILRKESGLPPAPALNELQQKLLAEYQKFENLERRGRLPEIRAAIILQEPREQDIPEIFLAHTNAVSQAYAGRMRSIKGDWERRIAYDRPRSEAARVELLPPPQAILNWQEKGWIKKDLPIYRIRVWRDGYSRDRDTFCFVNDRWVKLPPEALREDRAPRRKS